MCSVEGDILQATRQDDDDDDDDDIDDINDIDDVGGFRSVCVGTRRISFRALYLHVPGSVFVRLEQTNKSRHGLGGVPDGEVPQ